jgi:hypothetical protein
MDSRYKISVGRISRATIIRSAKAYVEVYNQRGRFRPQVGGKLRLLPIHIHNKAWFTYGYK